MLSFAELNRYKENNRIEAKRATGGFPRSLWETYAAFANTVGGIILLGVEEQPDHTFQPVQLPDPQWLVETFWQQVNDKKIVSENILEPEQVQLIDAQGYMIVMIEVPRAMRRQRPIYIGTDVYQGTYQRNGEGDYRCDRNQVEEMLQQQGQGAFDMEVLPKLTVRALEEASVQRYGALLKARHQQFAAMSDLEWLQAVGVLAMGADEQLHPTRAGLLLLGKQTAITAYFPGYFLAYREKKPNGRGWQSVLTSQSSAQSGNLLGFYFAAGQQLQGYVQTLPLSAAEREAVCASVQEGLANGLIHASYQNQRGIVVSRKGNAILITNPGPLTIKPEQNGPSPRNELLAQLVRRIGIGRGVGGGLSGIAAVWKKQGWIMPRLEQNLSQSDTALTLIFSSNDNTTVQEMQQEILLDYLMAHITVTAAEAARALQISLPAVHTLLQQLLQQDLLQQEGRQYQLKG